MFMGAEENEANLSPRPPVNNFARVEVARLSWDRIWEEYLGGYVARNAITDASRLRSQ